MKEMPMISGFHHKRSGKDSYPISSFTWLLIRWNGAMQQEKAIVDFLNWMVDKGNP